MMPMLLATKLFVPRPSARAIHRTRLFDRLEESADTALTLISAPAGFGKTALVSGWIRARPQGLARAAWLSLEEDDDDPGRFWSYLIEALKSVDDRIGESALQLLRSPQPPSSETIATIVLNDLAAMSPRIDCVLDDYHFVTAEPIHRSILLLVEHMPPGVRLIVTTRADPPWPLPRLRAGGLMTELRMADLRFTEEEARAFMERAGLSLSADDVRTLESRTEGWIAGLQMAALSMRGRADVDGFIRDFAGSHRFVLDYLAQEVLVRQPEPVRRFLVETSILERLNGDLCDTVTGLDESQDLLEALEQSNLFTESLDDDRRWYRYHQLFADVLRSHLSEQGPDRGVELHRRASTWLEAEGFTEEAVQHALEAHDVDQAIRLITETASATFMVGTQLVVLEWMRRLPREAVVASPVLALVEAWAHFVTGDWEGMITALEVAAESIGSAAPSSDREALQAQLDGVRSWVAYQTGDLESCVALAEAALPRMPDDGLVPRQIVACARGYGLLLLGEIEDARHVGEETLALSRRAGDPLTECLAISLQAQAQLLDGRLVSAARTYERAIATGTVGGEPLPSVAIAEVQLAEVLRERDDLEEAERTLRRSIAACEQALGLPEWVFEGNVTLARVLHAMGDVESSRRAAERGDDVLDHDVLPGGMEPIVGRALGYRARHWLATGQLDRVAEWLQTKGISAEGALDHSQHASYLLLARVLLARGAHERGLQLVERVALASGAEAADGLKVELALLKALALQAIGREADAAASIADALRVAEPEGFVRLFADEGPAIVELLARASSVLPEASGYVKRVRAAVRSREDLGDEQSDSLGDGVLREPLNERELELLRLLAAGRSNREIAESLYLSVNTVKWHARNLYGKLGVNRRALAVVRAKELGIL